MLKFQGISLFFVLSILCTSVYALPEDAADNHTNTLNKEALNRFGKQIEAAIANNNPAYVNKVFSKKDFFSKIEIQSRNEDIIEFNGGFESGIYHSLNFGELIQSQTLGGGKFEYIKTYVRNNEVLLLFRLFTAQGINYHEYVVERHDEKYYITDVYIYMVGEYVSEGLKRRYLTHFCELLPEDADLFVSKEDYKTYVLLNKSRAELDKGKVAKALKIWNKIHANYRHKREVQLLGLQLASLQSVDMYKDLKVNFEASFPDDPGFYLFSANALFDKKEYELSLECLDSLDKKVDDPMLDYLRGTILVEMGNGDRASEAYKRLIDYNPNFELAYLSLIDIYIKRKEYAEVTVVLDAMTSNLNYYKSDFQDYLKDYPDFINSSSYKNWINE